MPFQGGLRRSVCLSFCAPSSVRIERLTTDQKVGGSNPSGRATSGIAVLFQDEATVRSARRRSPAHLRASHP